MEDKEEIKMKTPRLKKPKRKKYTPKVIREVKCVVRVPKTPPKLKEKTPAKRKYIRKEKRKNVEADIQETVDVKRELEFDDVEEEKAKVVVKREERVWITYERRRRKKNEEILSEVEVKTLRTYARRKKKDGSSVITSIDENSKDRRGIKRSYSLIENSTPDSGFPVKKISRRERGNIERVNEKCNADPPKICKERSVCEDHNAGTFPVNCRKRRTYRMNKQATGWKNIHVKINDDAELQMAIVPYANGRGQMVRFIVKKKKKKKKRIRAQVDLDPETNRVWQLWMATGRIDDGDEQIWWEEERRVFSERVYSLIARMHLILGDRSFSRWKGSVLDSVTGVFLTQNTADHLSSSAFMSLAATFPLLETSENEQINEAKSSLRNEECTTQMGSDEILNTSKRKKVKAKINKKNYDWDTLRKEIPHKGVSQERSKDTMDALNYDAIRCSEVHDISQAIKARGQHNNIAERIKKLLNCLVRIHGSLDLEWLRDVPPNKVKEYLLSIHGLGLKSVECVRLLSLHQVAFPVDTNVGRICVRLGWVPLQPLPESLQLHLLEGYPMLATIQKYLWPRLCKLDQETLYNLHYMLITFGKVFCTKSNPNCNACPMRGECKHFASACASSRLALPRPQETSSVSSVVIASERGHVPAYNQNYLLAQLEEQRHVKIVTANCEPIIEEPATPEPQYFETSEMDIEDLLHNDPDEIPIINLCGKIKQNLRNYMQENSMGLQDGDCSKALVALTSEAASIPLRKLKNVSRLRTEHQAYQLPDEHPLLEGIDKRVPDDPCPYLLAIWTPGETAQSMEPLKSCCSNEGGKLCDNATCFSCNSIREAQAQTVRGTILIPSRTANRGKFPLNGTYFQVNEVFADHYTSHHPIDVPTHSIWNLPRRTVYFGSSVTSICRGLTTEEIQYCFRLGYICHRAFERETRMPKPLCRRLHSPDGLGKKSTTQKKTKQK
ncbi:protein ROS1-like [Asparagus officinalis]|uniref:protein ROS1-like n=1 Tax=Asparagus officinalis TaxID=4686 RepID=UPI00098E5474|nr:protein ROS1-like [Asparagus officinalis]